MLAKNLSVTLCTDNRLVSRTTICNEYRLALDNFAISPGKLKDLVTYGFKRSFYYHSYTEKRRYVRKMLDYYESLEKKHGIQWCLYRYKDPLRGFLYRMITRPTASCGAGISSTYP